MIRRREGDRGIRSVEGMGEGRVGDGRDRERTRRKALTLGGAMLSDSKRCGCVNGSSTT
jgi:hypothetical protein